MRVISGLVCLVALVGIGAAAEASPVYYTFTGVIDFAQDFSTDTSVPSIGGISVGDSVAWTFVADTSQPGYYTLSGSTVPNGDFYDAFVSGATIGPITSSDYLPYDNHYGGEFGGDVFFVGTPHPGQSDNLVEIKFPSLASLAVGQSGFHGINVVEDIGTGGSGVDGGVGSADFTLTNISGAAAVPEPATATILATGLLGLAALRRRAA